MRRIIPHEYGIETNRGVSGIYPVSGLRCDKPIAGGKISPSLKGAVRPL
jgi:hypothetical protein